ncbi:hypothetical protein [Streptomyces cellulosae]|uniref:hypothetical protein n=1 Tax=Streptomyces cellulosae TaxID=1968 RepID=UPI000689CCE1|nr:hypothetical protein [Streptomyces cellulosae]
MSVAAQFEAPDFDKPSPSEAEQARTGERWDPITLKYGDDALTVTNFSPELPTPSDVRSRTKLVKAGKSNPYCVLPEDAWHALARAVVHPQALAAQVQHQPGAGGSSLVEEHVGGATLRSANGRIWLTEVFPLIQPRIGQNPRAEADPAVEGAVTADGTAQAMLVYRFRNRAHLRNYLRQTVVETRTANKQYDESILTRRITRAVVAHVARIEFADGSESMYVMVVRDGITRVVSAWGAQCGEDATPDEIADWAVSVLLAEKPARRGTSKPLTQRMALGREDELDKFRESFIAGLGGGTPNEEAIRIGQTIVVPAQIAVGLQVHPGSGLPADEVFDDAVRSILSSIHVEFGMWDTAAQNAEIGSRALKHAMLDQVTDQAGIKVADVYRLAVGQCPAEQTPAVFADDTIPGTPLWRGVCLVHFLTRKSVFEAMKKHVKAISGKQRLFTSTYAGILGPMIDQPWRLAKKQTLRQSRNAWSNGGVLIKEVMEADWHPVPCSDFTTLVDAAQRGDIDARLTLAVAGGIALISDKLLTRNVGSAVGWGSVPFRADVDDVIDDLARSHNRAGLLLLAHAANRFSADRVAVNSLTGKQLRQEDQPEAEPYTHVAVDPTQEDGIARDKAGVPLHLDEYTVVELSNPKRAAKEKEERQPKDEEPKSILEQMVDGRRELLGTLTDAQTALTQLMQLSHSPDVAGAHPLGSHREWEKVSKLAVKVQATIYSNEPDTDAVDDERDVD